MESTKEEDDQNLTDPIEEKQESLAVRRKFNTGLITGDETRDSLSKDLISKVDKVQRCLTKLKTLSQNANEISIQRILSEVKTLNLSRYTGEVAESIAKIQFAIFKDGDQSNDSYYPCLILMTKICEIMHVRYDDFQKQLVKSLIKQYKVACDVEDFSSKTHQRKIILLFMTELFIVGIMLEYKRIFQSLQEIFSECKTCDSQLCSLNVMLISSYLIRYQKTLFNMKSRSEGTESQESNEDPADQSIQYFNKTQSEAIVKIIVKFYSDIVLEFYKQQYDKFCEEMKKYEENLKKIDRGSQEEFIKQKEYFKSLIWHMETLADLLDQKLPNYKSKLESIEGDNYEVKLSEEEMKYWPYDDIEQKKFYKDLPIYDSTQKETNDEVFDEVAEGEDVDPFEIFCKSLLDCVNTREIDDKTTEFISKYNTKIYRKRLAKFIFNAPKMQNSSTSRGYIKTNLSLLRLLCRMVAILSQNFKEVKNELLKYLQKEHQELQESQDILKIQAKKKNVRFIGELTKFELCDIKILLTRFKECLDDLKGHSAEIIFNITECCGRYLMRKEQMEGFTQISFNNMLDHLWEKKSKSILSEKSVQYIENSYFCCRPFESTSLNNEPDQSEEEKKINYLLFEYMNETTAEDVARLIKKMNLKTNEEYIINSFVKFAKNGTYSDLDCASYILSILQDSPLKSVVVKIIERLEKEILLNIEESSSVSFQNKIQQINFFSTLYYYEVIKIASIFHILETLIPENCVEKELIGANLKIRIVCTMLENLYFTGIKGAGKFGDKKAKKRLDKFLKHFHNYIHIHNGISMDLEFFALDTFESLRPSMKIGKNFSTLIKIESDDKNQAKKYKGTTGKCIIVDDSEEETKEVTPDQKSDEDPEKLFSMDREQEVDMEQQQFDLEFKQMINKSFTKGKQK